MGRKFLARSVCVSLSAFFIVFVVVASFDGLLSLLASRCLAKLECAVCGCANPHRLFLRFRVKKSFFNIKMSMLYRCAIL